MADSGKGEMSQDFRFGNPGDSTNLAGRVFCCLVPTLFPAQSVKRLFDTMRSPEHQVKLIYESCYLYTNPATLTNQRRGRAGKNSSAVVGLGFHAYPAGKGSNSIRRSMAPNSRRVK